MSKRKTYRSLSHMKKAFEKELIPQASECLVHPIDYGLLSHIRLRLLDDSTSHCVEMPPADYETDYKLDHKQTQKLKAAWSRIEPAMKEIGQLLRTNGVDNLYWIGSLSQGGDECECFEFMFPPGVEEPMVEKLADPILDLVQKHSPDDDVYFYGWYSLDYIQQVWLSGGAIPIFRTVSPLSYIN